GRITHGGGKLLQELHVPGTLGHQLGRLFRTDSAGRALTAAFVLEELHQIQRGSLDVVLVGEDHNRVRPYEAAISFEGSEIERDIGHGSRQNPPGGSAWQIALELVTILHPAAELVDQLTHRDACRRQLDARNLPPSRHREAAKPLAVVPPLRRHPLGAFFNNIANPEHGLDVLLEGWTPEQADLRDVRRAVARQAALALDRFNHRRL